MGLLNHRLAAITVATALSSEKCQSWFEPTHEKYQFDIMDLMFYINVSNPENSKVLRQLRFT